MARGKGSSHALEPLKERDPALFEQISADIRKLRPTNVAREAKMSKTQIYNFLSGNQNVSPETEGKIYDVVEVLKESRATVIRELDKRAKKAVAI